MGFVPQHREVLGLEDAHLLDMDAAPVEPEPLGYLFGLVRPWVRGPFSMRTVIVRQRGHGQILRGRKF